MKDYVVDMTIGVIFGGAFGKIVFSVVANVIMPCVDLLAGGVNFTNLRPELKLTDLVDGMKQAVISFFI